MHGEQADLPPPEDDSTMRRTATTVRTTDSVTQSLGATPGLVPIPSLGSGLGFDVRLSERRLLLITVDSLIVIIAVWGATVLAGEPASLVDSLHLTRAHWFWAPLLLVGWWLLAWLNDLYDIPSSTNTIQNVMRLAVAGAITLLAYSSVHYFLPAMPDPLHIVYFLALALPLIAIWRRAYAFSFDRPPFHHRVLIVGNGKPGRIIASALREGPGIKCKLMGYVLTQGADGAAAAGAIENGSLPDRALGAIGELPLLGSEADLPLLVRRLGIHEIVVATERQLDAGLFGLLVDCQAQGVRVSWMPDLYSRLYRQFPVECIDPAWAMHAMQDRPIFDRLQQMSKRALDLIVVFGATPLLLLVVLPLAIAIRLDSKGPVFYRQVRLGRGNRPFTIVKFRTMVQDAEKDGEARWATEDDPRITRVGRFLRKSRLDELPQIINVLKGDMSLVGPRPERPEFVSGLKEEIPFYGVRLMVKPGITGWAQIHYDYGNSMDDALYKLQYDFYYIRYWSLWLDLYILYRTVAVVARLKGT